MEILLEKETWRLRLATPKDNEYLCGLLRQVETDASIKLAEERDPDFFLLHNLHGGTPYTVVFEDLTSEAPLIFGCMSMICRPGWLDGEVHKVAFACDLRILPAWRNGQCFPLAVKRFGEYLKEREGVTATYFAVLSENERKGSFYNRGAHRSQQPIMRPMTHYDCVMIQLVGKIAPPVLDVKRATRADMDELVSFIAEQQKQKTFGFVFDEALFQARLRTWPQFSFDDMFIVRGKNGNIVACAAPWDYADTVRRSRVLAYKPRMKMLRAIYNLEAKVRGFLPLPTEGDCFRMSSLTHLEVQDNNPLALQSLLRAICQTYRSQPLNFINVFMPGESPLSTVVKEFRHRAIPMELATMVLCDSPYAERDFSTLSPGFEMALH